MNLRELESALSVSSGNSKTGNIKNETDYVNENSFVAPQDAETISAQQATPPPNSVPSLTTGILPPPCLPLELDAKVHSNAVIPGIDNDMLKFIKQLEDQKKLLMRGLESIVSAKLWFEKSLEYVNEKQSQLKMKRNDSSEPVKTVEPAENICNKDFSIGDAFGNFKFDDIAETENQIKSLVNTTRRLDKFLKTSKKQVTDRTDQHKNKKFHNKSTQTCVSPNEKPKADGAPKLDVHNYEADYEDESHDEGLIKSLKNVSEKDKRRPVHDIPRQDSSKSEESDNGIKEVEKIYELKQDKEEIKKDQEIDDKYDEAYYEDDFESDDDDSRKSSSGKGQKMNDKDYEALYEDDFETDDDDSTKS
uniref:RNA polymerase II subunit 5-mediating protein homolog isoform X1 n=1 Tax=Styela clava TaxID=7725 RepID=UPI00193A0EBA|nr:RNA polymerase II subunit 5-mediating protein homolog isoform X1 [Styela clava]XP_039254032.1 RNA polymerase II subunit 5-mediating protein homolog isoform X1 [Styela clava]XP_039254033.1 RNA polymerase II subunit 5-mediating protein homolog isoform X1 [Styela clava]